jgi:hypothetical protein
MVTVTFYRDGNYRTEHTTRSAVMGLCRLFLDNHWSITRVSL